MIAVRVMKTGTVVLVCAALVVGVVVWGEVRVSRLEQEIAKLKAEPAPKVESRSRSTRPPSAPGRIIPSSSSKGDRVASVASGRAEAEPGEDAKPQNPQDIMGEAWRAMMETDAGKAMMRAQNRNRASRIYGPLAEQFNLTEEERDYFYDLVGEGAGADDQLWMRLIGAQTDEERREIVQEYETAAAERRDKVNDFLNDGNDFATYEAYEARREEYEQLPALREAMQSAGVPLSETQEGQVVEAMYQARVDTGISQRWEGEGVIDQIAEPGMPARFGEDWDTAQSAMDASLGSILQPEQQTAFSEHRNGVKQMISFGLNMAEAGASRTRAATEGGGGGE